MHQDHKKELPKGGKTVLNNESNIYRVYESFEEEFKLNLDRELTEKEKIFLEWLAQKASDKVPPSK